MNAAPTRWADAPLAMRSMTPDEVRLALSDVRRIGLEKEELSEVGEGWIVDRDELVCSFLAEFDLDWEPAEARSWMDEVLGTTLAPEKFDELLDSPTCTMGELCNVIASCAVVADVQPARIMGHASWEATIFRVLRQALAQTGVRVQALRPSTKLEPYLREHGKALSALATRLAPGALRSAVRAEERAPARWLAGIAGVCAVGAFLCMPLNITVSLFGGPSYLTIIAGVLLFGITYACVECAARIPPKGYRWGEMETFGDVACVLAARRRAGSQPAGQGERYW